MKKVCLITLVITLVAPVTAQVTSVTVPLADGARSYTTTYPLALPRGLVRVSSTLWKCNKEELDKIKVIITRHRSNTVVVKAILAADVVQNVDLANSSNPDSLYKKHSLMWFPWWDDSTSDMLNYKKAVRNDQIRGSNRLSLRLNQEGSYHITVPYDADIEVVLGNGGDIAYASAEPTQLDIESASVNHGGHSGSSSYEHQRWIYYWHNNESDPTTRLTTKRGHIDVSRPYRQ